MPGAEPKVTDGAVTEVQFQLDLRFGQRLLGAELPRPGISPAACGWWEVPPMPPSPDGLLLMIGNGLRAADVAVLTDGAKFWLPTPAANALRDGCRSLDFRANPELFRDAARWDEMVTQMLAGGAEDEAGPDRT